MKTKQIQLRSDARHGTGDEFSSEKECGEWCGSTSFASEIPQEVDDSQTEEDDSRL